MRVEILEEKYKYQLQDKINKWLDEYEDSRKIIDIKYTGNGNSATYSIDNYSAMIIYEKNK
ncbi:hypothetical protein C672_3616 [[Clostridium] bifermentans ATCC 638]|uniref:Sporulation protein Cse60 n=1 Tax=Paraclostridium bifermentans ATCC 638 = DSM 14991 TaxID=1233171 RepID=T4V7U7_PARBF|nr:sporulation protein Cse60 [Paraclostridium bifermentans]EQK39799.1 hypothetical protein C672_3616 [[Clostridium] bifermentans ATCC 638] [Paraclostridium bifermentans ATCC 638 = DSM 14991]RIZ57440.1 DUF2758 domain-containing protein [Paraclostridium bifermentans]